MVLVVLNFPRDLVALKDQSNQCYLEGQLHQCDLHNDNNINNYYYYYYYYYYYLKCTYLSDTVTQNAAGAL